MVRALSAAVWLLFFGLFQHGPAPPAGISSETPSWSPDGTRLVFSAGPWMQHQIFVIDADGRNARRLTSGEQNRWPSWSPDGRSIVFMSDRDGQAELYAMSPDGSDQRRLTTTSTHEFAPAWSPRGDTIAYIAEMPGSKQQLGRVRADGSGAIRLDGDHLYYGRPAWLPDGSKLLLAAHRRPAARAGDRWTVKTRIYAYGLDGAPPTALTAEGYDTNPWPSPDGRQLLLDTGDGTGWASNRGQWDLWRLELATGMRTRLTSSEVNDWGAAWSPDGSRVAFSSGSNRVYALQVMSADGTGRKNLTRTDRLPDASSTR